jgi:hypothetical protein
MKHRPNAKSSRLIRKRQEKMNSEMTWGQTFEVLQSVLNKYFEAGQSEWSPIEIAEIIQYKTVLHEPIFLDRLKEWQDKGYILIKDKPNVFVVVKGRILD